MIAKLSHSIWDSCLNLIWCLCLALETWLPDMEPQSPEVADAMIAIYDQVLRVEPNNARAYLQRGCIWREKKDFDKALADFDTAIRLAPDSTAGYYNRAVALGEQDLLDEAMDDLYQVIEIDPEHMKAYFTRGQIYRRRGQFDLAIANLSIAIRLAPNLSMLYLQRSRAYELNQDRVAAIRDLDEAIRIQADQASHYFNRGRLCISLEQFERAAADFSEAIKCDPKCVRAYWGRSTALEHQHQYQRALSDLLTADEIDPREIPYQAITGLAERTKRAADQKLRDEQDAQCSDEPTIAAAYRERGIANAVLRIDAAALADLSLAIEVDSTSSISYAARGEVFKRHGQFEQALDDFDAAIRLDPENAAAWLSRGGLRLEMRESIEACDDLSEAIRLNPHCIRAYIERGSAFQARGEWELAISDFHHVTQTGALLVRKERPDEHQQTPSLEKAHSREQVARKKIRSSYLRSAKVEETHFGNGSKPENETNQNSALELFQAKIGDPLLATASARFDESQDPSVIFAAYGKSGKTKSQSDDEFLDDESVSAAVEYPETPAPNYLIVVDSAYLEVFLHRAECHQATSEWAKALADYQELIRLNPSNSLAYWRIARLLSTCPDHDFRNGTEAVEYATRAADGHWIFETEQLVTLAAAYAQSGEFEKAIEYQSEARKTELKSCEQEFQARQAHFMSFEFSHDTEPADSPLSESTDLLKALVEACERSGWKNVKRIEALADGYANAGQYERAVETQKKAHALNIKAREAPLLNQLELYRVGVTCE